MPEIVGTFARTELWDERANCSSEARNSSRRDLTEERLEFAVRQFDWIEVGRVFRQVAQRRVRFLNRLANGGPHVDAAVIHHDDVVAPERGNQALLEIGEEHLSSHGTFDHHWGGHFVVAQGSNEGDRLPCSKRNGADHPVAARSTPPDPHQVVLTAVSSINTNRAGSSMPCSRIQRRRARATSARCRSAACRLFFKVIPWRSRKRQSELRLVRIRRLRSSATVSTKVRSGCCAIRSSTCSANSSSGETLPPRGFGTALLLSCQRCSHFTAELTLTSKRSAVSRRDAPPSTASITRSRRSPE